MHELKYHKCVERIDYGYFEVHSVVDIFIIPCHLTCHLLFFTSLSSAASDINIAEILRQEINVCCKFKFWILVENNPFEISIIVAVINFYC